MSEFSIPFYGNLLGSNANATIIKNMSFPIFGTMVEATNYLVRDGLYCIVSGSMYYKAQGITNPIRILDSNIDGNIISGSVKNINNFRLDANKIKLDILFNSGSTQTLELDATSLLSDIQITSSSSNPNTFNIQIFESNGDVNTIPMGTLIGNYVSGSMQSINQDLSADPTKLVNRGTLNNIFNNFAVNNTLNVGRGLRRETINSRATISFGEINPTTPNIVNNTKLITSASSYLYGTGGTITKYDDYGGYEIETYNSADDLVKIISGSRDIDWSYYSAKFQVMPSDASVTMIANILNIADNEIKTSYIKTDGINTMYAGQNANGTHAYASSYIIQRANETQITQPINYIGTLSQNSVSASNLIHRGYVDTNFLNISGGGALIGAISIAQDSQSVASANSNGALLIKNPSVTYTGIELGVASAVSGGAWIQARNPTSNSAQILTLNPTGGNVGVGISNGTKTLTVNGSIGFGTLGANDLQTELNKKLPNTTPTVTGNSTFNGNLLVSGSIGIGTITPIGILDISSTTIPSYPFPRMTTTQINAITGMTAGAFVYDITVNRPKFYNGTSWVQI